MEEALVGSVWLGPALWAALYISDFSFTLACARLYQAQRTIVFEGSYEITPQFQADVNALRRVSPRFLAALAVSTLYLVLVRSLIAFADAMAPLYLLVLGMMLLTQATVHTRHLRNWYLFRNIQALGGHIEYPRGVILRASAFELFVFSMLYTALFFVTLSQFVIGGAIACCALSLNHYRLAKTHDALGRR